MTTGIICVAWIILMVLIRCNAENIIRKSSDVLRELENSSSKNNNKGDA